jgi:hypothetical protein
MAALLLLTLGGMALWRRKLLLNAFGRRLMIWFVVNLAGMLLNRIAGLVGGVAMPRIFVSDMLIVACLQAAGGLVFFRWLWIGAAVLVAGAFVGALWPTLALLALLVGMVSVLVVALLRLPGELRRREGAEVSPRSPDGPPR